MRHRPPDAGCPLMAGGPHGRAARMVTAIGHRLAGRLTVGPDAPPTCGLRAARRAWPRS